MSKVVRGAPLSGVILFLLGTLAQAQTTTVQPKAPAAPAPVKAGVPTAPAAKAPAAPAPVAAPVATPAPAAPAAPVQEKDTVRLPTVTNQWVVTRTEWTPEDDVKFGEFVAALAKSGCRNVQECIKSPANPYRDTDPVGSYFWSDCADWPYFLRAYYSWKTGLPFAYVNSIGTEDHSLSEEIVTKRVRVKRDYLFFSEWGWEDQVIIQKKPVDLRYTSTGNYPNSRARIAPAQNKTASVNFFTAATNMQNSISSGSLRFGPDVAGNVPTDLYPIDITREAVKPGTVAYSPNGHVSIVYEVTKDGRILLFNAHPASKKQPQLGTPVSRTTFETRKEYVRSKPEHGSGLKNWRPFKLVGATWKDGRYQGGKLVYESNNYNLKDFSDVQYYGTVRGLDNAVYVLNGRQIPYEKFIRYRLNSLDRIDPLVDFESRLKEVCGLLGDRARAVDASVQAKLYLQPHPQAITQSIFSSEGDWEDFATPSRDVRLRATFYNMRLDLMDQIKSMKANDPMIVPTTNLKVKLQEIYARIAGSCPITYNNSKGAPVTMSFDEVQKRLLGMSYDPYNCPERRWGAVAAEELASCGDDATKTKWYKNSQFIRNYLDKDWKAEHAITLDSLSGDLGFGRPKSPELNVKSLIDGLPDGL